MKESKRIVRFKKELVKEIPFFPNTKKIKTELLNKSIQEVLFYYLHWALRFIPQRKREVIIFDDVKNDFRWTVLKSKINSFLARVEGGEDLTPYLSSKVHKKGYTPPNKTVNGKVDKWEDKDFLLNVMGFHHFHLGENIENGIAERTNEVIFARCSREKFYVIAISDHSVFHSNRDGNLNMSEEKSRLYQLYDKFTGINMLPGEVYISNPITLSGHPLFLHDIVSDYVNVINTCDHKIGQQDFDRSLYGGTDLAMPRKKSLKWTFNKLDFGLLDEENSCFFSIRESHI